MKARFLFLLLFFSSWSANAATSFPAFINDIIRGTPGVGTVVVDPAGTVVTTGSGNVSVPAGRLQIPVPTTVATKVSKAAVAKAAARVAVRAIPWVGTAIAVKEIADGVRDSGIVPCPPPAYFCQTNSQVGDGETVYSQVRFRYVGSRFSTGWSDSAEDACLEWAGLLSSWPQVAPNDKYTLPYIMERSPNPETGADCGYGNLAMTFPDGKKFVAGHYSRDAERDYYCPDGRHGTSAFVCTFPESTEPVNIDDFNEALARKLNANHDWAVKVKQQMDAVARANPGMETPIDYTNVPVEVKASPVTAPESVVSTRTFPNPDGTTSTETVREQTTVTPQISPGGTVSSPGVSYPSKTVTTTTTVNNVTNVTNVVTNNTNNPAPEEKVDLELPTDYNREATQRKILEQLDGSQIDQIPEDQEVRQKREIAAVDSSLDDEFKKIPSAFQPDKENWFSWVWTPPVGQCEPSMFSGFVSNIPVKLDICLWVDRLRDVIGFLFSIFGAISIYTNLFRKAD